MPESEEMPYMTRNCFLCIVDEEGRPLGSGFAIDDHHVLTCTHLGEMQPESQVRLNFPLLDEPVTVTGNVVQGGWHPIADDGSGDLAVVRLSEPVRGLQPAPLLKLRKYSDRRVLVQGAAQRDPQAPAGPPVRNVEGRLAGHSAAYAVQVQADWSAWKIEHGFSGGPVWDIRTNSVIGMIVLTDRHHAGHMLPMPHLAKLWPPLNSLARLEKSRVQRSLIAIALSIVLIIAILAISLRWPRFDEPQTASDGLIDTPADASPSFSDVDPTSSIQAETSAAENLPDFTSTITQLGNLCSGVDFPYGTEDAAAPFHSTDELYSTDESVFFNDAIDTGAYANNSLVIEFVLQTEIEHEVTIYDVQAHVEDVESPKIASHVSLETCGSDNIRAMALQIDAPDPGPYARDEFGNTTDQRFFDSEIITVSPAEKPYVLVDVYTLAGPFDFTEARTYSFTLELSYEVNGDNKSATVDMNGEPFRLSTGQECYDTYLTPDPMVGFSAHEPLVHTELFEFSSGCPEN